MSVFQDLMSHGGMSLSALPWYGYAAVGLLGALAVQTVSAVAKQALETIERDQAEL